MTIKATWLGGPGEPDSCEWMGVTFPKGEPIEITNEFMIRKAKGNPFFVVDDPQGDHMAAMRDAKAAKKKPAAKKVAS